VTVILRLPQISHFKRSRIFLKGKSAPKWERKGTPAHLQRLGRGEKLNFCSVLEPRQRVCRS
jgi:hypothetical protein